MHWKQQHTRLDTFYHRLELSKHPTGAQFGQKVVRTTDDARSGFQFVEGLYTSQMSKVHLYKMVKR